MRFLPVSMIVTSLFLFAGLNGCKENCDDIQCAPAPPLLTVLVQDTLTEIVIRRQLDTLSGDSVDVPDTVVNVRAVTDAHVTLNVITSGMVGLPFATVSTPVSDTLYTYRKESDVPVTYGEFALVAARGSRADTLENLRLQRVDGCCGYEIIGNYKVRIPER